MERDNGLEADAFVYVGKVDADRSDELLDDLAAEGIAAYAVSGEPDERLYVDRRSVGYAKALLRRSGAAAGTETADAVDADDDAAWEQIVADFDRDGDDADDERPWPEAEDLADDEPADDADADSADSADDAGSADAAADEPRTVGSKGAKVSVIRLDTDDEDDETDDDHYVKPEPPSLPKGDLWTKLAWVVMLAALAYPITGLILDWDMPGWSIALAVVVFIAGIVTHVVRLRDPHSDADSDDGAVV